MVQAMKMLYSVKNSRKLFRQKIVTVRLILISFLSSLHYRKREKEHFLEKKKKQVKGTSMVTNNSGYLQRMNAKFS